MNCPICNRPLRIVPEQVGVDGKGLPVYHRIAYCDYCKKRGDLDIPNNGLTGANNPNGYNKMNTGSRNPGNSSKMLQPNKNSVNKNGIVKVIAICFAVFCVLFAMDSLFSSDQSNNTSVATSESTTASSNDEQAEVKASETNDDERPNIQTAESFKDMKIGEIGYVDDVYVGLSYVKRMNYLPTVVGKEDEIGEGNEVILGFFDFYNWSDERTYVNPYDITCYVDGVQVEDVDSSYKIECDGIKQFYNVDLNENTQMMSVQDFAVPSGWNEIKFYYESKCVWTITQDDVSTDDYEFSSMYDLDIQREPTEEDAVLYQGNYEVIFKGVTDYTWSTVFGDRQYIVFKFSINNTGEETIDYSTAGYEMAAYQNNYYLGDADYGIDDKIDGYSNIYNIDTIEPGMTTNIYVAFEAFVTDGDLYMIYDDGYIRNKVKGSVYVER